MGSRGHRAAYDVAARQDGLVTWRQALDAGMTRHQIVTEHNLGRWLNVQPKVYAVAGTPPSWRRSVRACVLAALDRYDPETAGPRTPLVVVSHTTAAALLGLDRVGDTSRIEVSGVGANPPVLHGVEVHRTRMLERCDVTWVDGIPVTSGARTLVDLAARLDRTELTALLDDAVCARVVARKWMYRRATALHLGRKGAGRLVRLTGPGAEEEFRSWLERRAAFRAREFGLPRPLVNYPLRVGGRLLGVVDNFWVEASLPVEWDGMRFHSSPRQQQQDRARDRGMTLAGFPPLRYSWLELEERPHEVMAEIARALRSRGMVF